MSTAPQPHEVYIYARRVLLDALTALRPHLDAVILVGAQAVYLRTEDHLSSYQPYTTDADVVINPKKLADEPSLRQVMTAAGFEHTGEPGRWQKSMILPNTKDTLPVPVDLIVPSQVAPKRGRRSARLPKDHGKDTARKITGIEGALIDRGLLTVPALDKADERRVTLKVAGKGALLVAKAYKLGERLNNPKRLLPKDAGDVYRIFDSTPVKEMVHLIRKLLTHPLSMNTAERSLEYLRELFAAASSPGTKLAVQALTGVEEPAVVAANTAQYTQELLASTHQQRGDIDVAPNE